MNWKGFFLSLLGAATLIMTIGLAINLWSMRTERDDAIWQRDVARKQWHEARAYIEQMEKSMITLPAHSSGTLIIGEDGQPRVEIDKPGDRWNIGPNGLPQLENITKKPKEDRVQ